MKCLILWILIMVLAPSKPLFEPLNYHPKQRQYAISEKRYNVIPAGRRSGKTAIAKRRLIYRAMMETDYVDPNFFVAAPTRDQVKRIYWDDLKTMIPDGFMAEKPHETELMIPLINGSKIFCIGMDKPARIEGSPWNGGLMDEYADMKAESWSKHVRPACTDRLAWIDFLGVPEGRNHYYKLYLDANTMPDEWQTHTWTSEEILPLYLGRNKGIKQGLKGKDLDDFCKAMAVLEIEEARRELDELTFDQEYNASFISFEGRAYYNFSVLGNTKVNLPYNEEGELVFCFDFNRAPGVAAVCQEGSDQTFVIGEVYIPRNSTTPAVCRKLIQDWEEHKGHVFCYGDATGGAKGSAKVAGSDWDLIEAELRPIFQNRLHFRVSDSNPKERARINAVNSRIKSASGKISLLVDQEDARHTVRCLDSTPLLKGGAGEIDKSHDSSLTHLSDALGYYIAEKFPIGGIQKTISVSIG